MTYAYVANTGGGTVSKINLSTFTVVGTALAVGSVPQGITIAPASKSNAGFFAFMGN